jgi:GH35 family endo-1,4-beta-xylanase
LPKTRAVYQGIEDNAAWRSEAAKRIDQYRKAELSINVLNQNGKPANAAQVHIKQQRHAFPFGTAMNVRYMASGDAQVPAYKKALLERFNAVVFENGLKWWNTTGHTEPVAVAKGIEFVKENDLFMRGHVLVWPSARFVPGDVRKMIEQIKQSPDDETLKQTLRQAVEHRITWMTTEMAGKVNDWDVANETFANHDIMDALDPAGTPHGKGVLADWFKLAHKGDPNAQLYLNDYGILTNGNPWSTHQQYFYDTVKDLIDSGAPINGIGMQAHFGAMLTAPTRLWEVLDQYAKLGLRIKVTEFDIDLDDPQLKADYTRDFFTALFAHPQVDGLLSWGFWAGAHWRPDAAFLDKNFKPRPNDIAMRDLLFKKWWTDVTVNTNAKGNIQQRVFKGKYVIDIKWPDGHTQQQQVTVDDGSQSVTVKY